MLRFLIYGITKDDGLYSDPDAAIDKYHYWRKTSDGVWDRFQDFRQNVVDKVKTGMVEAYTYRNNQIGAKCIVKVSPNMVEYLKTTPNGNPFDNLSSLPEM
ncbi:DUF3892 domain-containing protein [Candidatus Saccharibacteria bacterium]|nr:DUF3892 domain-containing protein [Candidatus Saccharibacteria bacterium]